MAQDIFELAKAERASKRAEGQSLLRRRRGPRDVGPMRPAFTYWGRWITVQEAAKRLGLKENTICHMMSSGTLFHDKNLKNRQLILESDVEREEHWRKLRREGWKPAPAGDPVDFDAKPIEPAPRRTGTEYLRSVWIDHDADDAWIPIQQAMILLDLSATRLRVLGAEGRLKRRWADPKSGQPTDPGNRRGCAVGMYSMRDLETFMKKRAGRGRFRTYSSNDPNRPQNYVRSEDIPPTAVLISIAQAANMLGISRSTVSAYVRRGKLLYHSKKPGKSNVPVQLFARQIYNLARSEDRLRHRNAWLKGKGLPHSDKYRPQYDENDEDESGRWSKRKAFVERYGLVQSTGRALEKNHGEFYTTAQAARVLGIRPLTVLGMRQKGRLTGYRSPTASEYGDHRWWFFKKIDVHNLQADPDRLKRRRRYWRARQPWAYEDAAYTQVPAPNSGPVTPGEKTYIPHDPRNRIFLETDRAKLIREMEEMRDW